MFGFKDNKKEHKILKKGELVICDLDSMYIRNELEYQYKDKYGKLHVCYPLPDDKIIEYLKENGAECVLQAEIGFQNRKKEEGKRQEDER